MINRLWEPLSALVLYLMVGIGQSVSKNAGLRAVSARLVDIVLVLLLAFVNISNSVR
jgi:hypothetical protein